MRCDTWSGDGDQNPPSRQARIPPDARRGERESGRCCARRGPDHDAADVHPIGSADGNWTHACRSAADVPPRTGTVALGAGSTRPAETPPMNPEPISSPPHERNAADYDQPYAWGRPPSTYLAPREVVRLMILRSRLDDRQSLRDRGRPGRSRRRAAPRRSV
jgi:hypothetical protein